MKRGALLYVAGLLLGAVAVFCATYFFGRHTSLEVELERLTARRPAPPAPRSGGIPSLQQQEAPRAPEVPVKPEGEPLGEGVLALRSPLESPGLVVVADLPALGAGAGDGARPALRAGLDAFLARPPAGLLLGVRALAGAAGECGGTDLVRPPGPAGAGETAGALDADPSQNDGQGNLLVKIPCWGFETTLSVLTGAPQSRVRLNFLTFPQVTYEVNFRERPVDAWSVVPFALTAGGAANQTALLADGNPASLYLDRTTQAGYFAVSMKLQEI